MSDITPLHCIDYGCFKCTLKVHVHFESTLPIVNHIDVTVFELFVIRIFDDIARKCNEHLIKEGDMGKWYFVSF